jgi:hypothetical protein
MSNARFGLGAHLSFGSLARFAGTGTFTSTYSPLSGWASGVRRLHLADPSSEPGPRGALRDENPGLWPDFTKAVLGNEDWEPKCDSLALWRLA